MVVGQSPLTGGAARPGPPESRGNRKRLQDKDLAALDNNGRRVIIGEQGDKK